MGAAAVGITNHLPSGHRRTSEVTVTGLDGQEMAFRDPRLKGFLTICCR